MWFVLFLFCMVQTDDYENAIRQNNKQQVLLQQIVKEYTFVIAGVYFKNNRQTFQESIKKFENRLNDLTNGNSKNNIPFAPTYELIEQYEKTNYSWRVFKTKFSSDKFKPILKLQEKLDKDLKNISKMYLNYTKAEYMTLSDTDYNILRSEIEWYLSEKLMTEVVLFMLDQKDKSMAYTIKNMFQESIQHILDLNDESDPNYPVIEDIQSLWRTFDEHLYKVLTEEDKNKIFIMNLHKTQTLLLKRIDHYKEVVLK